MFKRYLKMNEDNPPETTPLLHPSVTFSGD